MTPGRRQSAEGGSQIAGIGSDAASQAHPSRSDAQANADGAAPDDSGNSQQAARVHRRDGSNRKGAPSAPSDGISEPERCNGNDPAGPAWLLPLRRHAWTRVLSMPSSARDATLQGRPGPQEKCKVSRCEAKEEIHLRILPDPPSPLAAVAGCIGTPLIAAHQPRGANALTDRGCCWSKP